MVSKKEISDKTKAAIKGNVLLNLDDLMQMILEFSDRDHSTLLPDDLKNICDILSDAYEQVRMN